MILELNLEVEVEETAELLQHGIYIQKHNKRLLDNKGNRTKTIEKPRHQYY